MAERRLTPSNIQQVGDPYLTPNQARFQDYMSRKTYGTPLDSSIPVHSPSVGSYSVPPRNVYLDDVYSDMMNKRPMTQMERDAMMAAEEEERMAGMSFFDRFKYGWNRLFGG